MRRRLRGAMWGRDMGTDTMFEPSVMFEVPDDRCEGLAGGRGRNK